MVDLRSKGREILGVELDDKSLGVSYVLDTENKECCMRTERLTFWFVESGTLLKKALGLVVGVKEKDIIGKKRCNNTVKIK